MTIKRITIATRLVVRTILWRVASGLLRVRANRRIDDLGVPVVLTLLRWSPMMRTYYWPLICELCQMGWDAGGLPGAFTSIDTNASRTVRLSQ